MDTIHYAIHDLIDVVVDARVSDTVLRAIDFQIGFFKITGDQPGAPRRIIVKPYDDFTLDPTLTFHSLHPSRGISGQCLDRRGRNRVALEKRNDGYTIYVDQRIFAFNLFIQLLLVEHGVSLISAAAAIDANDRVTLLAGAGRTGKTVLSVNMVKCDNYRLLGDDTVVLSKQGECFSFPRSFTLKDYNRSTYADVLRRFNAGDPSETNSSVPLKLLSLVRDNAPFLGLLNGILSRLDLPDLQRKLVPSFCASKKTPYLAAVPITEIVDPSMIADRGSVERIVFLERYAGNAFRLESISEASLCRRMIAIIHNEWALSMRQFFMMGALELVDLPAYFNCVAAIIRSGISGKSCEMLLIPDDTSPDDLWAHFSSLS
jgi:hypothetical protein